MNPNQENLKKMLDEINYQTCGEAIGNPYAADAPPTLREEAEKQIGYHREQAERFDQAATFFRENPAFDEFVRLIRKGAISIALLLAMLLLAPVVHAQSAVNATVPPVPVAPLTNIYAAGVSYSVNAMPSVAGTALYAHLIDSSGTYAFTAVDALPNTLKPFTVSTNIGVGIGQKVATLGRVPIYVPTAAGISFNGVNTGWEWNAGALASVHVKGNYYILPSVRFLKSSVSGGTGYQPIIGVLFGWGN